MKRSTAMAICTAGVLGVAAIAAVSFAGSARPDSGVKPGRDRDECFDPKFVRSFQTENDHKVVIISDRNQAYELTLAGVCIGLDTSFRLGIQSKHGATDVCGPFDADIVWEDMGRLQSCSISGMRHLTGDEATPYVRVATGRKDDGGSDDRSRQ